MFKQGMGVRAKVKETASTVSEAIAEFRPKIEGVINSVRQILVVAVLALVMSVLSLMMSIGSRKGARRGAFAS